MTEEVAPLLEDTKEEELVAVQGWRSWSRLLVVGAASIGAAVVALAAHAVSRRSADAADEHVVAEELQGLAMYSSYAASLSCYSYTGGSCSLETCDVSRSATCQNGKCVCEAACAGPDGMCHRGETNALVATDFTLANVYWPKYSMYFQGESAFGQMKTTSAFEWMNLGKDKFSLYRMPGPRNTSRFLLGSNAFPTEVARIAPTAGTAFSGHGLYATDLSKGKGPDALAVSVCYDQSNQAIMLGDTGGKYWAYVHRRSWLVYGTSSERCKVGSHGLWKPTPEFSKDQISMLPKCC